MQLALVVIDTLRPRLSNLLSKIRLVRYCRARYELHACFRKLLGRKRNTCNVVHIPLKFCWIGFQELHSALDTVVNVHHRESGIVLQKALVVVFLKHVEKYLGGVVSGSIKGVFFAGDDAWVAQRSKIQIVLALKIITAHFIENFANAVDCLRLQNNIDWSLMFGELVPTEYSDARR